MLLSEFQHEKAKSQTDNSLNSPGIDHDIYHVLKELNHINFLYTIKSCSGSPRDHESIGGAYQLLDEGSYGISRGGYQGYVLLTANTSDNRFDTLKKGLEQIANVKLSRRKYPNQDYQYSPIQDMALQVFVPDEFVNPNDPLYLPDKWNQVYVFLKGFNNPQDAIKARLKHEHLARRNVSPDPIIARLKHEHRIPDIMH